MNAKMKHALAVAVMVGVVGCSRVETPEIWVLYSYESGVGRVNAIASYASVGSPELLRNDLYYIAGKSGYKPTGKIFIDQIVRIK